MIELLFVLFLGRVRLLCELGLMMKIGCLGVCLLVMMIRFLFVIGVGVVIFELCLRC